MAVLYHITHCVLKLEGCSHRMWHLQSEAGLRLLIGTPKEKHTGFLQDPFYTSSNSLILK